MTTLAPLSSAEVARRRVGVSEERWHDAVRAWDSAHPLCAEARRRLGVDTEAVPCADAPPTLWAERQWRRLEALRTETAAFRMEMARRG